MDDLVEQAKQTIKQIETDFQDPNSITRKIFLNKGQILRLYASSFEILSQEGIIDLQINEIANHIYKRTKELDEKISKTWIYDELPTKYKSHRANSIITSEGDRPESGKRTEDDSYISPEEENKPEIEFYIHQIDLCKKILSHLKSESYLLKKQGENYSLDKNYREELIIRTAAQKLVEEAFDNRKSVPVSTISLLLDVFIEVNNKYAANVYISKLKEYGSRNKDNAMKTMTTLFSSKQFTKILKGHVKELHQSMEINTQQEAYDNGFYGKTNCSECGSWRVILEQKYIAGKFEDPKLSCFSCNQTTDAPKVKLPLSRQTPK